MYAKENFNFLNIQYATSIAAGQKICLEAAHVSL